MPAQSDNWRISYIPHTAFGGPGYVRAYGWGYLSWPGIVGVVGGAAALAFGSDAGWKVGMVFGGFGLIFAGVFLNGLSERRSMSLVRARCLDVEIQFLPAIHMQRSSGWAVRARMGYFFQGRELEATPGQWGYDLLGSRASAEAFAAHLKAATTVSLLIDPKHPTRALFVRLRAG